MGKHPIDRLIEAKEAKIALAEKAIGKLRIEISALRQAREAVAESGEVVSRPNGKAKSIEPRKGRSISDAWKRTLAAIGLKYAVGASLDEIARFAAAQGIELKRPTLRAQMSNYVKRDYLERTGDGNFSITQRGAILAGLEGPPEVSGTPAQTGAPENGDTGGSSSG